MRVLDVRARTVMDEKAQAQGVARKRVGPAKLYREALATMRDPREATRLVADARIILPRP